MRGILSNIENAEGFNSALWSFLKKQKNKCAEMKNYSLARMKKTLFFFMVSFAMKLAIEQQNIIRPTELWPDNNGKSYTGAWGEF